MYLASTMEQKMGKDTKTMQDICVNAHHSIDRIFRRQRLMYSTPSLFPCKSQGWVGGGGRWGGGGWVGGWGGGVTDTFKQRENQNKEKLTKVAAYEL